ncbi:OmpA family protein [Rubrimonas cliftonensis]|uniref:OmpA-OmpF porin, OOP family n=1 Tax=Rubrimonas cliftonensis TaxID=89524 RepID=A0A1H4GBQ0_9RHOB|nr:OmpA family protein [Rubrimonas cliftonensis]SEB06132.1 OmpA-OmpF porin, OOP family [Rubrimonas cliftonensis]
MRWRARAALGVAGAALLTALAGAAAPAPFDAMAPPDEAEPIWSSARAQGAYAAPVAPVHADPDAPATVALEGGVAWATWRMASPSSRAAARAFAAPYLADGFETVLDCDAASCGGFAFRLKLQTAPWPEMRLSALDLHQITLRRGDALASILASMAGDAAFVQVVTVENAAAAPAGQAVAPQPGANAASGRAGGAAAPSPQTASQAPPRPEVRPGPAQPSQNAGRDPMEDAGAPAAPADAADLAAALRRQGRAVLRGVTFESGGAAPDAASAAALDRAAQALALLGGRSAVLVGHTDGAGPLAVNMRVGAARAEAVRAELVARGVAPGRLQAEGAGWLAPIAPNDSDANRALNRRVELLLR